MDDNNNNNENKHNSDKKELKHTYAGKIVLVVYQTKKSVHWKHKKNNIIDRFQKERKKNGKIIHICMYLFNTFIFTSMHITFLTQ
jgi:hypothetical protein